MSNHLPQTASLLHHRVATLARMLFVPGAAEQILRELDAEPNHLTRTT